MNNKIAVIFRIAETPSLFLCKHSKYILLRFLLLFCPLYHICLSLWRVQALAGKLLQEVIKFTSVRLFVYTNISLCTHPMQRNYKWYVIIVYISLHCTDLSIPDWVLVMENIMKIRSRTFNSFNTNSNTSNIIHHIVLVMKRGMLN